MIGHDLMAWPPAPPTRLGSRRWGRKVLTDRELIWHSEQSDPRLAAAMLWVAKEAAYKLAVKKGYPRKFRPKDFEVGGVESSKLKVQSCLGDWFGCLKMAPAPGYLLAVVAETEEELSRVALRQRRIEDATPSRRSTAVRELLRELLAEKWPEQANGFRLLPNAAGVPEVWLGQKRWPVDVSLSHDGEWGSVALVLRIRNLVLSACTERSRSI